MLIDHRYEVIRSLGSGGMGAVYLAADRLRDRRQVAVKTIRDPRTARWFEREFRLLSRLNHPNLAAVHDFGWDAAGESHYFTAEFVDGGPLAWDPAVHDFSWLLERVLQLCRALHYVHQDGLLHCDVKPENVLVERENGRVRLLDFGVAMAAPGESVLPRGTLPYMAPEWLRGAPPDPRADLYGLGMLLFRVTVGRFPFQGAERDEILRFHLEETARFPADVPSVPSWWGAVVERLLAKRPEDRFPTVAALVRELAVRANADLRLETAETWAERLRGGRWIGRAEAVASLRGAIDEAVAESTPTDAPDPAVLVLLKGEAGVGKSRLLEDTKRACQLRRLPVLLEGGDGEGVFGRLVDSLRTLVGDDHAAWRDCGDLLAGERDGADEAASIDTRTRRVEAAGTLLLAAAAEAPLIVLLDAQASGASGAAPSSASGQSALDALTAEVLSYTLHAVDFALTRPGEAGGRRPRLLFAVSTSGAVPPPLDGLARHRLTREIELPGLYPTDLPELLTTLLGERALPEGLGDEVRAACGGNPGAVVALLAYLLESGSLRAERGELVFERDRATADGVPQTLEDALRGVFRALPSAEREALVLLSLSSLPYPVAVLADAAGAREDDIAARLAALESRSLAVSEAARAGLLWAPTSRTLATVVTESVPEETRRDGHRRLAAALTRAGAPVAQPAALAEHYEGSAAWGPGWAAALDAARSARRRGALDRALAWIGRARQMAERTDDAPARLRRVAAEERAVRVLRGEYDEAVTLIRSVLGQGGDGLPAGERARWLRELGDVLLLQGSHDDADQALGEALDSADDDDHELRAAALATRGRVAFYRGRYDDAGAASREALETAGAGDSLAAGRAENTLALVEAYTGSTDAALEHGARAAAVFERLGDLRERAFAANSLALVHHRRGDWPEAVAGYARSLELARRVGDHARQTIASMNLSVAHQATGQYREAIEQYLESLERAYRVQDRESLMRVSNNLGNIYRFLGRLEEAAGWLGRSIALAVELGSELHRGYNDLILGEVHLLRGEPEAARRRIWAAEKVLGGLGRPDAWLESRLDQAAWLRTRGDYEEAEAVVTEVAERAQVENLDDHRARALLERAQTALAVAESEGSVDVTARALDAVRAGLQALALVEGRDTPELRWRVAAALARAYVHRGTVDEARHHLQQTARARAALEEDIPAEMRPVFFERSDRRELQDAVDRAATQLQEGQPSVQMAPAALLPAGSTLLQLLDINKSLNSEHRLDRLLNMIMDAVIDLTGAERGFIILSHEGKLRVEVARNIDRETIRRSKYKISHSIAEEVIETGAPVFATDAQDDERYRDYVSIHALKLRSIVCIPLQGRDTTFGAIYLDNRFQANAFAQDHRSLLEAFAEQAAVAITNARLHERNSAIRGELERSRDQVERLNRELERKLVDQGTVLAETREALTRRQDQLEARYRYGQLIGHSPGIQRVYSLIDRVKDIDVPVIIHGDSGTGKELVARAIHYNGSRRKQEVVSINCAAFPEGLLESELFGHKRGAFTGADRDKKGLFQVAHRGTLFLDEVGDMSLGMQAKLLRALQEHEIRPVGGHEALKVDVRIIAASNKELKDLIAKGLFREDLYYRLNVVTIRIPPLRERREDIPLLVEHFLDRMATRTGQPKRAVTGEAMKVLMNYAWPGNVRELESTVTTASLFAAGDGIDVSDLANKPELLESVHEAPARDLGERTLAELEREAIIQALIRTRGNKMAAAKSLGISRRSLYNKLAHYDIQLTRKTTVIR